jgi:NTE family protein
MLHRSLVTTALLAGLAVSPARAQIGSCAPARTALVLSGGGAKGFAHIGVLRVLDSLGIVPDFIVGTSMGAVVGSMYASGYTGLQIDSIVRHSPGGQLIHTFEAVTPGSLGTRQPQLSFAEGEGVSGLQTNALNVRDVNALLEQKLMLGNLSSRGNFDSLPIPFRAVATNLRTHEPVVMGHGDLPRSVRASISIPLVFTPIFMDGTYLADGGLVANVPVGIARELGAQRVIVSDLSIPQSDTIPLLSAAAVSARLLDYLADQPRAPMGPDDIYMLMPVQTYATLDFEPEKMDALLAMGLKVADSVFARASCLNPLNRSGRRPLELPRYVGRITRASEKDPALKGQKDPAIGVLADLGLVAGDSIPYPVLRTRTDRLSQSSLIEAVWLYPSGSGDSVSFAPVVHPAPRFYAAGGVAYDNVMGGEVWLGVVYRNLFGLGLETSALVQFGGLRDEAVLGVRKNLRYRWHILAPALTLNGGLERIPVYDENGTELESIDTRDLTAFVGVERSLGNGWSIAFGGVGRLWYQPDDPDEVAGGITARAEHFLAFEAMRVLVDAAWTSSYSRAFAQVQLPWGTRRYGFRSLIRAGAGTDLPLQLTFALGGSAGFPGIQPSELRGSNEVSGQVELWYRLVGPLEAQLDLGGGSISEEGDFMGGDSWLGGVRVGLGATTPLGPVKVGYGWATGGREALLVRVFRWF